MFLTSNFIDRARFGLPARRRERPARFERDLQALFHQQLWCWGRDICQTSNLLLRYGMHRERPAEGGEPGSSRYIVTLPTGMVIHIWAFGVAIRGRGRNPIYLHRYRRGVALLPPHWTPAGVHHDQQMQATTRPQSPDEKAQAVRLLDRFLGWVVEYERWVLRTQGSDYRMDSLKKWEHVFAPGPEMAAAWQRLADAHHKSVKQLLSAGYLLPAALR